MFGGIRSALFLDLDHVCSCPPTRKDRKGSQTRTDFIHVQHTRQVDWHEILPYILTYLGPLGWLQAHLLTYPP